MGVGNYNFSYSKKAKPINLRKALNAHLSLWGGLLLLKQDGVWYGQIIKVNGSG